jgi:hypothetical protein
MVPAPKNSLATNTTVSIPFEKPSMKVNPPYATCVTGAVTCATLDGKILRRDVSANLDWADARQDRPGQTPPQGLNPLKRIGIQ